MELMNKSIGIIGLGAMGARMAQRLLDAGHDVAVYNRTAERAKALVEAGATAAQTPRGAASGRDIVVSMVRDDDASRAVWLDGETGALAALRKGAVAIESSTLTPAWTTELANAIQDTGATFLDAPVAGSRPQAEAGKLIYLVGGDGAVLDGVREVLLAMGAAVHHVGPIGAGMSIKLAVNALFGVQVAALAELLGMLRRSGIADMQAMEVLCAMPITSAAAKGVGGLMAARKFDPMFPIALVEKDLGYAADHAERLGTTAPTTSAVRAVYARALTEGFGADNITGVAKLYD